MKRGIFTFNFEVNSFVNTDIRSTPAGTEVQPGVLLLHLQQLQTDQTAVWVLGPVDAMASLRVRVR